jgi:hypothetical protein
MITVRLDGLKEAMEALDPENYKKAMVSALNKVGSQGKTEGSTLIRDNYNIKKKDLDPLIKITYAKGSRLIVVITATGWPIPLTEFGAKQLTAQNRVISKTKSRQLKRASKMSMGVTVSIIKGRTTSLPKAFIHVTKKGFMGVFVSVGDRSIKSKSLVSPATLFGGKKVMSRVIQRVQDQWPIVLSSEIDYYLSRRGR